MTDFARVIDELRGAVADASSATDPELRRALGAAGFPGAEAVDQPSGELSHVWLDPPEAPSLAELELRFGPAHRLPPRPDAFDSPAVVQFNTTIPAEGTTGATVLAEVDATDRIVRVTLRRDRF